jgi:hypothetical protein
MMQVDKDSMRTKRWRQPVLVSLAVVTLCFVLPYLAHASGNKSRSAFRLALPASPFSSAAVADFNSDAKPDIAIADRTGSGSQGYTYRLQVGLSLEPSQVFHFRSPHSLTLSVLDFDNDQDLDVILTRTFSDDVVGVWINNGRGQFHPGNTKEVLHGGVALRHRATLEPTPNPVIIPALPVRKCAMAAARPIALELLSIAARRHVDSLELQPAKEVFLYSAGPRAPPRFFLSDLS